MIDPSSLLKSKTFVPQVSFSCTSHV